MSETSINIITLLKGVSILFVSITLWCVFLFGKKRKRIKKVNKLKDLKEEYHKWKKIKEFLEDIEINDYQFHEIKKYVTWGIESSQNAFYKEIGKLEYEKKEELIK